MIGTTMSEPRAKSKLVAAIRSLADGAIARYDSWQNLVTGQGVSGYEKALDSKFQAPVFLDDQTLANLFHSHDLAERMVSIIPQEMLREGFAIQSGDPELDATIDDKCTALDLRAKFVEAETWGRCFGGGALLIGADDGRDASLPLIPERAKDLSFTYAIDRRLLWPLSWYSEYGHPKFGQPETYMVTTMGGPSYHCATVHESRLILFRGAPTGARERTQLYGWDTSYLQRAHDVIRSFDLGWSAVETMLTDGNQAIFKISGLDEMVGAGGETVLTERMRILNRHRSFNRALVIDADKNESFERQQVSLTDVPATLDRLMVRLAAAVQIPVTILMGQSPAGMNATGDADFRWFHARVRAEQTRSLAPKIRKLVQIWLATKAGKAAAKGKEPKTLGVHFPPLWTDTPVEQATREKAIAERDEIYIINKVLTKDEVALHRFRPGGFSDEIQLSDKGIAARETSLAEDLDMTKSNVEEVKPLEITPTDIATIATVNEARRSVGLSLMPPPDGELTITEFKAKYAAKLAEASQAGKGLTTPTDGEKADGAAKTVAPTNEE